MRQSNRIKRILREQWGTRTQQTLRRIFIRLLPTAQGVPRTRTSYLANHGQAGRGR